MKKEYKSQTVKTRGLLAGRPCWDETISYIASLCSFEFGPAVFEARSLSLLFDTTDYEDDCGDEIHYRKENGLQENTFNLFPNPTSDEFTLRYTLPENCDADFVLTDITGRIILHRILNSEGNEQQFSTSDYSSGLYLYSIRCNGSLLKQDKVVIVR